MNWIRKIRIPVYRWIISSIFFFLLSLNRLQFGESIIPSLSFWDLLLLQTTDGNVLCFAILFILVFLAGDLSKTLKAVKPGFILLSISTVALLTIGTFVLSNLCAYLFFSSSIDFSQTVFFTTTRAAFPCLVSISLLFLRCLTTFLAIYLINLISYSPMGAIAIIFLSIIDYNFYYITNSNLLYITPLEHTMLIYDTLYVAPASRPSVVTSVCYWVILITAIWIGIVNAMKRKNSKDIFTYNKDHSFIASVIIMIAYSLINYQCLRRIDTVNQVNPTNINAFYYSAMTFNILINTLAPIIAIFAAKDRIFCVSQDYDAPLNLSDATILALKAATKGGLVFIVFELVYILLLSFIFPISSSFNILVSGTFAFLSKNIYLYLLCFLLNSFLVGFIYTAFAFSISINNVYPLETFIIPQLYYVFRLYCPFEWMINFLPMDTYDIASKTRPLGEHAMSILIILPIIALILYLKLGIKKRSNTK
ncbi:MAG: hypothetical protein PUC76_04300 [Clostridia bacterium]|nr:hypothetical protein [Clostridia bacterium]